MKGKTEETIILKEQETKEKVNKTIKKKTRKLKDKGNGS